MARNLGFEIPFNLIYPKVTQITGWTHYNQLSDCLGVAPSVVNGGKKRNSFPISWAYLLAEKLGISIDWLLFGVGHPYLKDQEKNLPESIQHQDDDSIFYVPKTEVKLSAGGGAFVLSEKIVDRYAFRREWINKVASRPNNLVMMDVIGDSMLPTIHDGDAVLVDTGRQRIYDGRIYAIRMDHTVSIKRLGLIPAEKIRVTADNREEYPPYETNAKDLNIIGQAIWYSRTLVRLE